MRVDLLSGEQSNDRDAGVARPPASRAAAALVVACQRVATRSSSAIWSSILTWRSGWARRRLETSRRTPCGPRTATLKTRDATHVVVGDQVVDQLQASFVPDQLDEQPHRSLVALAHAVHRGGTMAGGDVTRTREGSRGFPLGFQLDVYRRVVPPHAVEALLERERELEDAARRDRSCVCRRRDAHADRGPRRRRQDRASAGGAGGGRGGPPDAAGGEGLGARAAVCVRRRAPAAGANDRRGGRRSRSVRGRGWSRGALVRARRAAVAGWRCGLRGLAQPVLVARESRRSGLRCSCWSTTASGSIATRCGSCPTWRSASRGSRSRCSSPDVRWSTRPGSLWAQVASRPSAVALYPRPLSESAAARSGTGAPGHGGGG